MDIIRIPSKSIYDKDNPKVRDNVIERIEVESKEVVPSSQINTSVYSQKKLVDNISTLNGTSGGGIITGDSIVIANYNNNNRRYVSAITGLKFESKYTITPEIYFPKNKDNSVITKIIDKIKEKEYIDGEEKEVEKNNIKVFPEIRQLKYDGTSTYNTSTGKFDYEGATYGLPQSTLLQGFENISEKKQLKDFGLSFDSPTKETVETFEAYHSLEQKKDVYGEKDILLAMNYIKATGLGWQPYIDDEDDPFPNYIEEFTQHEEQLIQGDLTITEETIDKIEYYKISSVKLFIGLDITFMSSLVEWKNESEIEGLIKNVKAVATKITQTCTDISFNVYGDTIGIDLQDKTVYINGQTAKKVHSIDGNELMQTSNYVKIPTGELIKLTQGSPFTQTGDYRFSWLPDEQNATDVMVEIHNPEYIGSDIIVRVWDAQDPQGIGVDYEFPNNDGVCVTNHGYYLDIQRGIEVYARKKTTKNATETMYGNTQNLYKRGKETATIRCSISDYYNYESGDKVISVDNSTGKMCFEIGDKIIPMVYGADGNDYPMSRYQDGTPKVFQVLGTRNFYDGAVWQELYLQELDKQE